MLRNANDQEFFKLKEQLMMTFKDQMELRRGLMELGNTSMEISLESSRNALILSEWEAEQSKAKEVRWSLVSLSLRCPLGRYQY